MYKSIVKEAFDEGREVGGDWEDSEAKVVSEMLPIFDVDAVKFRQRQINGRYGKVFADLQAVKEHFINSGQTFNKGNFIASIYGGWNFHGQKWEAV